MGMVMRRYQHSQQGFSFVEVMVAIAILGILAAIATPNMKEWSRNYYLKSASTTLYSHMQIAKLGAVKDNQPWTVNFNPGTTIGYDVRNSAGRVMKLVDFRSKYTGAIQFGNPTSSVLFDRATLTFYPNGISDNGFAYLASKDSAAYYRIGLPLANGAVRVQKWNGSLWE
jgi:prepilin-type N-terminal cleavage/methylation domain-containing protein